MKVRDYIADDEPTTPADTAREHLDTIARGWRHVLDPIHTTGAGVSQGGIRSATEEEREEPPDARLDTPRTLAFWVHAALDEWPTILQTLQEDEHGNLQLVTTETIDCTDVPAMARLLHREVDRIIEWVEPGHDYGHTFTTEVAALARAVKRVAWPPKGDRITVGECPTCGRRVRVKAPTWMHLPQPTTDPATYPEWAWLPNNAKPITCRCARSWPTSSRASSPHSTSPRSSKRSCRPWCRNNCGSSPTARRADMPEPAPDLETLATQAEAPVVPDASASITSVAKRARKTGGYL